jgi:predicted nuclease of restriction endonuclease-like (RecB) superfamily
MARITRIRKDILREERAEYGEEIVATLSQQLTAESGKGRPRATDYAATERKGGGMRGADCRRVGATIGVRFRMRLHPAALVQRGPIRGRISELRMVHALSAKLGAEFGQGFSERNLANMVRCAEAFSDAKILHTLCAKLSWSHFRRIIYLDDPLKRDFYAEMCRMEQWSVRTLHEKIQSMLFERTALSKKPAKLVAMELKKLREEDKLSPDLVFRDPYLLDFLRLKDTYAEKDVESAILREMEAFILELGVGFCFVERQKRMQIDGRDYYLDLLFYHRKLRRLIAIDLKIGDFEAGDKGQMELYLNWLKRYECEADEAEPMGMILCAGKTAQHVELLELEKSRIHVAAYWTKVLPRKLLEQKLHEAVRLARARLQALKDNEG